MRYFLLSSICVLGLIGCAAEQPPNFSEKLKYESQEVAELGASWEKGRSLIKDGEALVKKGDKQLKKAKGLKRDGEKNIKKGERLINKGGEMMRDAEEAYEVQKQQVKG